MSAHSSSNWADGVTQLKPNGRFLFCNHAEIIGNLTPDLIVDDAVIVDPKVVSSFNDAHVAQMVGYLAIAGLKLALLLNFKNARLEWKRVVRQHESESDVPDLRA